MRQLVGNRLVRIAVARPPGSRVRRPPRRRRLGASVAPLEQRIRPRLQAGRLPPPQKRRVRTSERRRGSQRAIGARFLAESVPLHRMGAAFGLSRLFFHDVDVLVRHQLGHDPKRVFGRHRSVHDRRGPLRDAHEKPSCHIGRSPGHSDLYRGLHRFEQLPDGHSAVHRRGDARVRAAHPVVAVRPLVARGDGGSRGTPVAVRVLGGVRALLHGIASRHDGAGERIARREPGILPVDRALDILRRRGRPPRIRIVETSLLVRGSGHPERHSPERRRSR